MGPTSKRREKEGRGEKGSMGRGREEGEGKGGKGKRMEGKNVLPHVKLSPPMNARGVTPELQPSGVPLESGWVPVREPVASRSDVVAGVRDSGAPQVQGKSTLHGQYAQASIPTYFNIKKLDKVIAKIKKCSCAG